MTWFKGEVCEGIYDALGETVEYDYANITSAPWYDSANPESARFFGVFIVDAGGEYDSTRSRGIVEGIGDGGVLGSSRKGPRELRMQAIVAAQGLDALEYGMAWLSRVLDPGTCGQHGTGCGMTDLAFFAECPPTQAEVVGPVPSWNAPITNQATNPSAEATSTLVQNRLNLVPNPSFEVDAAGWQGAGAPIATISRVTTQAYVGTASLQIVTDGTVANQGAFTPGNVMPAVAGRTYTGSVYLKGVAGRVMRVEMGAKDAAGAIIGARTLGPSVTMTGGWDRVSVTLAGAPVGTAWLDFVIRSTTIEAHTFYADAVLIEASPTVDPYFDGANRPRLRENLEPNPSLTTDSNGWIYSGGAVRQSLAGPLGRPGIALVRTASSVPLAQKSAVDRFAVTPGDTISLSATGVIADGGRLSMDVTWVNAAGAAVSQSARVTLGAETAPDVPTRFGISVVAPASAVTASIRLFVDAGIANTTAYVTDVMAERAAAPGEFFSGSSTPDPGFGYAWVGTPNASPSYLYDDDLTPAWTGTANASATSLRGPGVTTFGGSALASTRWSDTGAKSARTIPTGSTTDTWLNVGGDTGAMRLGMEAGKTYTLIATFYQEHPQSGILNAVARAIRPMYRIGGGGYNALVSENLPNVAGVQTIRHTFTLPVGTTEAFIRLQNGSQNPDDSVWWDSIALVEGEYTGPYFDGDSADSQAEDFLTIGKAVVDHTWTGTAHASTSTRTTGVVLGVEDPVAYDLAVNDLYRFTHNTGVVSGPLVKAEHESHGFYVNEVEFTFTSEHPYVFKATIPVEVPPSLPVVVQDIPYNLVPYPSAELASGTVVVATNLAVNPSAETNATGWGLYADNTNLPAANVTIATSTELEAVGAQSAKVLFTAVSAGASGKLGVNQTVTLTGIGPTTRYSVNMWAVGSVESGTAVLGSLNISVYWQNASSATLREDTAYTGPASGGPATLPSVLPPAGTTKVLVRAWMNVTSWSTGAKVRVYADALAVTVP